MGATVTSGVTCVRDVSSRRGDVQSARLAFPTRTPVIHRVAVDAGRPVQIGEPCGRAGSTSRQSNVQAALPLGPWIDGIVLPLSAKGLTTGEIRRPRLQVGRCLIC